MITSNLPYNKKLRTTNPKNAWVKAEITIEIRKYFLLNRKNKIYRNLE